MSVKVDRKEYCFKADSQRVIPRYFVPGDIEKVLGIVSLIMKMTEKEVCENYGTIIERFANLHRDVPKILIKHFMRLSQEFPLGIKPNEISYERTLLIGAYFTLEYSFEGAAYFNPSIVPDPDQSNLKKGELRVILSFRAVGEGHVSSVAFVSGIIDKDNNLITKPKKISCVESPETIKRNIYNKKEFFVKLNEMKIPDYIAKIVYSKLNDTFIYGELINCVYECLDDVNLSPEDKDIIKKIQWVARSHYEVTFSRETSISERVLFPISYSETKGIEDVRFVKFTEDSGETIYYGTYTAYNGNSILPKMIETTDFYHFKTTPIHGENVQNKGMALFPRKINGQYAMLTRIDGINNYIMFSDNVRVWKDVQKIQSPRYPWEFVQVGNCGSPHETKEGWLLLTHGVGPMRTYCIGAILLDLEDPTKILGRLKRPLLMPNEEERKGYVPNVVYTCGSIIHNNELIMPYSQSDSSSKVANINVQDLVDEILREGE